MYFNPVYQVLLPHFCATDLLTVIGAVGTPLRHGNRPVAALCNDICIFAKAIGFPNALQIDIGSIDPHLHAVGFQLAENRLILIFSQIS